MGHKKDSRSNNMDLMHDLPDEQLENLQRSLSDSDKTDK